MYIFLAKLKPLFFLGIILLTLPFTNDFNSKIIIISLTFFLFKNTKDKTWKNLKYYWSSFLFFLIQFASFAFSSNFHEANKKLILFLPFIAFPFLFSSIKKNEVKLYRIFSYLLYGILIVLIYGGTRFFYDILVLNERYDYGRGIALLLKYMPHHVYLSILILITMLSITYGVIKKEVKQAYLIFLPVLYLILFFLGSRTAIFISVFILPFILFYQLKKKYRTARIALAFISLFIALTIVGLSNNFTRNKIVFTFYEIANIPTIDLFTNKKPFNGVGFREQIWESSADVIKDSPVFGQGIGDVQYALNTKYSTKGNYNVIGMNAHNQYLQFALTYGIIISIIILFIIFYYVKSSFLLKNYFLFYTWLILLIFSFTESILNRHLGVIIFAFILNISIYEDFIFKKKL